MCSFQRGWIAAPFRKEKKPNNNLLPSGWLVLLKAGAVKALHKPLQLIGLSTDHGWAGLAEWCLCCGVPAWPPSLPPWFTLFSVYSVLGPSVSYCRYKTEMGRYLQDATSCLAGPFLWAWIWDIKCCTFGVHSCSSCCIILPRTCFKYNFSTSLPQVLCWINQVNYCWPGVHVYRCIL